MSLLTRVISETEGLEPHEIVQGLLQRHGGRESDFRAEPGEKHSPEWVRQARAKEGRVTSIFPSKKAAKSFHADLTRMVPGVRVRSGRSAKPGYYTDAPYQPKVSVWPHDVSPEREQERAGRRTHAAKKETRRKLVGLPKTPVTSPRRLGRA